MSLAYLMTSQHSMSYLLNDKSTFNELLT